MIIWVKMEAFIIGIWTRVILIRFQNEILDQGSVVCPILCYYVQRILFSYFHYLVKQFTVKMWIKIDDRQSAQKQVTFIFVTLNRKINENIKKYPFSVSRVWLECDVICIWQTGTLTRVIKRNKRYWKGEKLFADL